MACALLIFVPVSFSVPAARAAGGAPGSPRKGRAPKKPDSKTEAKKDKEDAERERTLELLAKTRISFDFVETPFADVLSFLSEVSKLTFSLDGRRVPDPPALTLKVKDVALRSALAHIRRLTRLDYVVGSGLVVFTTRAGVYELDEKVVRIYKVGWLSRSESDEMVGLIRRAIAPGTWGKRHGTLVAYRSGLLSVRHIRRVHREVVALLEKLRE